MLTFEERLAFRPVNDYTFMCIDVRDFTQGLCGGRSAESVEVVSERQIGIRVVHGRVITRRTGVYASDEYAVASGLQWSGDLSDGRV